MSPGATTVLAPCAGRVIAMSEVPDEVFAAEMVGPGVAIAPPSGRTTVVAPVAGKVLKIHPHAFVILSPAGAGILVHLGIDTNRLKGKGFEVHAQQGDDVEAGQPMVTWDPGELAGLVSSTVVPVLVMDGAKGSVTSPLTGTTAEAGDVLFTLPA